MILVKLFQTWGSYKTLSKNWLKEIDYSFKQYEKKVVKKDFKILLHLMRCKFYTFCGHFLLFTTITTTTYILVFMLVFVFIKAF